MKSNSLISPYSFGPIAHHNDGNRLGRVLGRPDRHVPSCYHDDINLETHQLGRKLTLAIRFSLCVSILDDDVFPLHVPQLAQTLPERLVAGRVSGREATT